MNEELWHSKPNRPPEWDEEPSWAEIRYAHGRPYRLPSRVRRFLRTRLEAYANRRRMMMAVTTLALIIGQFQCGPQNFVGRGCGIGGDGAGFFLARAGLVRRWGDPNFTEALIREAIQFLLAIGFIERITPKGDLVPVKRPKNATECSPDGYFRYGLKATKDSLGRIRSPLTRYRLGAGVRNLFSEALQRDSVKDAGKLEEPLCKGDSSLVSPIAVSSREDIHRGCAPYDRAEHDPNDPRFDYYRPDPMKDPHRGVRVAWRPESAPKPTGQQLAYRAMLEERRHAPRPKMTLSPAALAIFNRPPRST